MDGFSFLVLMLILISIFNPAKTGHHGNHPTSINRRMVAQGGAVEGCNPAIETFAVVRTRKRSNEELHAACSTA